MVLLFIDFLGTQEVLVIALVALIIFGPRKLPELGRSLGKSLGEFRRATEDFKRTWEREVEVEKIEREVRIGDTINSAAFSLNAPLETSVAPFAIERERDGMEKSHRESFAEVPGMAQTAITPHDTQPDSSLTTEDAAFDPAAKSSGKHEWL